jgi:tRNA-uridine 2-sulfurtransferase
VDSSVSAYLLKKDGFAVSGIHLELSPMPADIFEKEHDDLERTCRLLEIPLIYLHLENEFQARVKDYFCHEYSLGRTPNPCVRCNQQVKFGLLLDKALEMGASRLATGHYSRIEKAGEEFRLLKGADPLKDQSYFLYILGQKELSRVIFPVGAMPKAEVKGLAAAIGLPAAGRRESQDICFIAGNDSRAFLGSHLPSRPGDIVDSSGKILGRHSGLAFYTIGQRQGMGVSAREPLYVIRLDSETNRLVVGPSSLLYTQKLRAGSLNWISGQPPEEQTVIGAKVRYRSAEAEALLELENGTALVTFKQAQRAIAPGQSIVFYRRARGDDVVLGGGIIVETL